MKIFIPIKPKAAPRPRVTMRGTYNPTDYTQYKFAIGAAVRTQCKEKLIGPIEMSIEFIFKVPKSWPKKKRENAIWHTSKPDIDNLQKAIKDALNGIAYKDDAQVCSITAKKRYGDREGVLIKLRRLDD